MVPNLFGLWPLRNEAKSSFVLSSQVLALMKNMSNLIKEWFSFSYMTFSKSIQGFTRKKQTRKVWWNISVCMFLYFIYIYLLIITIIIILFLFLQPWLSFDPSDFKPPGWELPIQWWANKKFLSQVLRTWVDLHVLSERNLKMFNSKLIVIIEWLKPLNVFTW